MANALSFAIEQNKASMPVSERTKRLADPGFGRLFTDHMVMIKYKDGNVMKEKDGKFERNEHGYNPCNLTGFGCFTRRVRA